MDMGHGYDMTRSGAYVIFSKYKMQNFVEMSTYIRTYFHIFGTQYIRYISYEEFRLKFDRRIPTKIGHDYG